MPLACNWSMGKANHTGSQTDDESPENRKEGGLEALEECLKYWMYAFLNEQEILRKDEKTLIFRMN